MSSPRPTPAAQPPHRAATWDCSSAAALAKVLEDQTFSLKAGEATAPIRTRQGFVILKVTEHADAGVPPLKDVEPQIQEAMYMQAMQPALRAYLTKLREEAYIDISPGFVDSGASPKQTKPVYTAYSAPVVKKKKVQQKQRFDRGGRYSAVKAAKSAPAPAVPPLRLRCSRWDVSSVRYSYYPNHSDDHRQGHTSSQAGRRSSAKKSATDRLRATHFRQARRRLASVEIPVRVRPLLGLHRGGVMAVAPGAVMAPDAEHHTDLSHLRCRSADAEGA